MRAIRLRVFRANPPVVEQRLPHHHVKLDLNADRFQVLLHELVHRQGLHLTGAGRRNLHLHLERLAWAITGFGQQLLRAFGVVFDVELRIAIPGVARWHHAFGWQAIEAKQAADAVAVNRQIHCLAHLEIGSGVAFDKRKLPRPGVRVRIAGDLVAARLQLRNRIGRRRFDPINLARQERVDARIAFRHRYQHQLVGFRHTRLVPVGTIALKLQAFTRHQAHKFPRAGTDRGFGKFCPALRFGPCGGAGDEQVGQVDRQKRIRLTRRHFHRRVVDLARTGQRRHARQGLADQTRVVMRCVLLQHLLEIEHDRIGVDVGAVMKFRALAQFENPLGLVLRIHRPALGQTGNHHRRFLRRRQIPHRQAIKQSPAGEAVALKAGVRLAGGGGDVGGGHADAQRALGQRSGSDERQRCGQGGDNGSGGADGCPESCQTGKRGMHDRVASKKGE